MVPFALAPDGFFSAVCIRRKWH